MTTKPTTYQADVDDLTSIATACDDLLVLISTALPEGDDQVEGRAHLAIIRAAQRKLVTRHLMTDVCEKHGHHYLDNVCFRCSAIAVDLDTV